MIKNYLTYPLKAINISQTYSGRYQYNGNWTGHYYHNNITPKDYPIDDVGVSGVRDYFYCPCDEVEIKNIYGVGNPNKSNTFWIQSTSKVITPIGEDFVTILVIHPEDDDMSKLYIGQKFERGQPICLEGKNGMAIGYHFHISVGLGKYQGNGWVRNNNGMQVIYTSGNSIKPEEAFFINTNFTTIKNNAGLSFQLLDPSEEPSTPTVPPINTIYYRVSKADESTAISTFTSKEEAIAYIKNNSDPQLYVYDENNQIIYPENIKLYSISLSSNFSNVDQIINKYILLENAINKANELKNSNNKIYYIFNSDNKIVYATYNNWYVLRKSLTDEESQKDSSEDLNKLQNQWINLQNDEKTYNQYKIYNIINQKTIIPYTEPYAIKKNNNIIEKYSNQKDAITKCNNLGFPHIVYDLNYNKEVYNINFDLYSVNDIIGIIASKKEAYDDFMYIIKNIIIVEITDEITGEIINKEKKVIAIKFTNQEEEEEIPIEDTFPYNIKNYGNENNEFYINCGLVYSKTLLEEYNNFINKTLYSFGDKIIVNFESNLNDDLKIYYYQINDTNEYIEKKYLSPVIEEGE